MEDEILAITNIYAVHAGKSPSGNDVDGWWVYGIQVGETTPITWFTQNAVNKLIELLEIAREESMETEEMN